MLANLAFLLYAVKFYNIITMGEVKMKQSMFSKQGQKGFTLLELLIVVTIIAILSVGAILAYEGLTEKAQTATAANNTVGADQAIRNFRAVTGNYPNQWDHLVAQDGAGNALDFVADETYLKLATVNAPSLSSEIVEAFEEVGIDEIQVRSVITTTDDVEPNLQHNEGAAPGESSDLEIEDTYLDRLVVVPTAVSSTFCTYATVAPAVIRTDDEALATPGNEDAAQNFVIQLNDSIGEDACHMIVAFGFGHDAAHSTANSNVAIAAAPTFVSSKINPADNYARYIALFDIGEDESGNLNIEADEIYNKPKLLGILDTEGRFIDQTVAAANDEGQGGDDD